ncbi:MAG: MFS transporter [Bryobacteraceae bacterium]|nr:MFS transporter [Bryobacteraceae bacterium]
MTEFPASRRALAGFFLSGLILSFPGAILPAWGYHLQPRFVTIGNYFLAIVAGMLIAVRVSNIALRSRGSGQTLIGACAATFLSVLLLSFTAPPVKETWRIPCLAGIGFGAGLLNTAIFQAISPAYRLNPAATVNLAGIFFGLGSFVSPLLIAATFNVNAPAAFLYPVASIPALFALFYLKYGMPRERILPGRPLKEVAREFTIPGAILLSLVLFFHFGNEWAIAGWLPLFLILRLGLSPVAALILLAAYWLALLLGRIAVQALLHRVSHPKLLLGSVLASLFGCVMLSLASNLFGAWCGTLLIGLGFAPVYPLVVEAIGARFPHYHPGLFNGIFSIGLTGGMLAPAMLGYFSESFGIRVVMLLPAAGTFVVLILILIIWLEAWFTERTSARSSAKAGG